MRNFWARLGAVRLAASFALVAIALLALAFVGGFATAGNSSAAAQYQYLVPVCHKGSTIRVAVAAVPALLAQADTAGPCP